MADTLSMRDRMLGILRGPLSPMQAHDLERYYEAMRRLQGAVIAWIEDNAVREVMVDLYVRTPGAGGLPPCDILFETRDRELVRWCSVTGEVSTEDMTLRAGGAQD